MTMETQEQNKPKKRRRSKGAGFAEDTVEVTETPIAEPTVEPTQPDPEPSPEPSPEPVVQAIPPRRKTKFVARPMRRRQ